MSSAKQATDSTTVEQHITDPRVARLAVEAGKYLGLDTGDELEKRELKAQAIANGYSDRETRDLLADVPSTIEVPPQGDLFGDLWRDDPGPTLDPFDLPDEYLVADNVVFPAKSENPSWEERPKTHADSCHPEPLDDATEDIYALHEPIALDAEDVGDPRYLEDGEPLTALEAVGSYIRRREGESVSAERNGFHDNRHSRDRKGAYKWSKRMDRQVLREYENPTVALLSLRVSPSPVKRRVTLLKAIDETWASVYDSLAYRLQNAPDAPLKASQWEWFAVFAGTAEDATPHLHIVIYCEGDVPRSCFAPAVEKFVEECPYAPDDGRRNDPSEDTISIRGNGDDIIPRMDDAPEETQAATYVLTQLPHLSTTADDDRLETADMARDDLLHASSVDAWGGRHFRKSTYQVSDGEEDFAGDTTLSESERDFVDDYLAADLDPDPALIRRNIDENFSEFPEGANVEAIVSAIQERQEGEG